MNKTILDNLIKKPPASDKKKYIFLNDNSKICEAIITVGFVSVYIDSKESPAFHSAESFVKYIRSLSGTGTSLIEYVFVLACYRKKTNDVIEFALKANQIDYRTGAYTLFKDKEYLGQYEYQDELEKNLVKYINRYEGPDEAEVDKEQFLKRGPDGQERGIMEKRVVDYIIEALNFFVIDGVPYIYHGGVYREDGGGIEMKAYIQSLLYDRYINYRTISGVYRLLIEQQQVQKQFEDLNNFPKHWINFRNGFFDVVVWKLYKHSPKYLAINQIPHELNIKEKDNYDEIGPESKHFLEGAIPDVENRKMLFQFIGYAMTFDTCFQKFMIFKGLPGTGKSTIITLLQHIIGGENTTGLSMQDLTQRFFPSQLRGKLLNACADIPSSALNNVDVIKKATGEDLLMYERKGVDPSTFRSYAKLVFSANEIPLNLDEKSDALYRRMLILVMNQKPAMKNLTLTEDLIKEIDYWIWKGIEGLKSLYMAGEFFESIESIDEVEKLHRAADTIRAFMAECTERQQGAKIKRNLLYDKYCEYCKGYGRRSHGAHSFYKELENKGYVLKPMSDGRYVLDISFKDDGFIDMASEEAPL